MPYPLVKPILERCSIEQLSRLEQASPVRLSPASQWPGEQLTGRSSICKGRPQVIAGAHPSMPVTAPDNAPAEIWKDLCFRKYRMTAEERYSVDDVPQEPDSWRFRYFVRRAPPACFFPARAPI